VTKEIWYNYIIKGDECGRKQLWLSLMYHPTDGLRKTMENLSEYPLSSWDSIQVPLRCESHTLLLCPLLGSFLQMSKDLSSH
jgi:hypothetical protein